VVPVSNPCLFALAQNIHLDLCACTGTRLNIIRAVELYYLATISSFEASARYTQGDNIICVGTPNWTDGWTEMCEVGEVRCLLLSLYFCEGLFILR
jgi:hypothetical protein